MAAPFSTDLLVGIGALAVAGVAIYMFMRASGGVTKTDRAKPEEEASNEALTTKSLQLEAEKHKVTLPRAERQIRQTEVERARNDLITLTLKSELLTLVLKRLFEAEDEGEITREERIRLSADYEAEMKSLGDKLKQAELIVTLNELESIRDEIIKKFESTLNETQSRIDSIIKELKPKTPRKPPSKRQRKMKKPEERASETEEEVEEEEEETPRPRRRRSEVEEKLEQLRKEVLDELEELEKLEIGA
jgi:hypothetical protein